MAHQTTVTGPPAATEQHPTPSWRAPITTFRLLPRGRKKSVGLIFSLSALSAVVEYIPGRWQYQGMDYSVAMNSAWELSRGRVPYNDFLTAMPASFLATLKVAFWLGANFQSLLIIGAITTFVAAVLVGAISHAIVPDRPLAPVVGVLAVAAINVPVGYPWYNPTSTTIIMAAFALTILVIRSPNTRWVGWLPAIWTLTAYSKASTALPALALSSVVVLGVFVARRQFLRLGSVLAGTVLLCVAFEAWMGFTPSALVNNYRDWQYRLGRSLVNTAIFGSSYAFGIAILIGFAVLVGVRVVQLTSDGLARRRTGVVSDCWPRLLAIATAVVGAVVLSYGVVVNNELKTEELASGSLVLWLALADDRPLFTQSSRGMRFAVSALGVAVVGVWWPATWFPVNIFGAGLVLALIGIGCVLITLAPRRAERSMTFLAIQWGRWLVAIGTLAVALLVLQYAFDRRRDQGQPFYQGPPTVLTGFPASSALHGDLAGPDLHVVTTELDGIARNACVVAGIEPNDVFVGPRIDFGYAEGDWLPPRGLPIWWEAYAAGDSGKHYDPVATFTSAYPKLAIFPTNDRTFLPATLDQVLESPRYRELQMSGLDVYVSPVIATCLQKAYIGHGPKVPSAANFFGAVLAPTPG